MEKLTWTPQKRKVKDLKIWQENPRSITEKGFKKLKDRIIKRGFHDVVKIDTDSTILSGNQRKRALEDLGVEEVYVMIPSRKLTEQEREAVAIESNREDGAWDFDMLANFSEDILKEAGFVSGELDRIFGLEKVVEDDFNLEAELAKIKKPETKYGQVIELGKHRLMCGDATKEADVKKLMKDDLGQMVFTDPPYNVSYDYESKYRFRGKRKRKLSGMKGSEIFNDNLSDEDFYKLLLESFKNYYKYTRPDMAIYLCHASNSKADPTN